jgi:hypothetical protein
MRVWAPATMLLVAAAPVLHALLAPVTTSVLCNGPCTECTLLRTYAVVAHLYGRQQAQLVQHAVSLVLSCPL